MFSKQKKLIFGQGNLRSFSESVFLKHFFFNSIIHAYHSDLKSPRFKNPPVFTSPLSPKPKSFSTSLRLGSRRQIRPQVAGEEGHTLDMNVTSPLPQKKTQNERMTPCPLEE